ncbi:hypothetical protein BX54_00435 [Escherichia coli O121:H19 str. 2010C-3840]|nr:hypothetical protein BX62_03310 [Escherichia coli O121:H19 str. 2010C-4254]EYV03086.1 hypothetical protein BX54_00435 [Escherichia coli O121:H19 str. 2010C-3840]EYV03625.1 hypothetical protein BX52_03100 [Escherichia coli O121:H19 str. 2010C-3609]EYV11887.1 hypothetical protein BX51_18485 [Escherichia coli O145:NM str. 2010C-3526]EYV21759.1 hypothetical protein BX48_10620 [Escherichia coli O145:NM str. 2010C-3517]EYV22695.1 hypothetical protein BX49_24395 [Escherichia coli O145:NM str. 2010
MPYPHQHTVPEAARDSFPAWIHGAAPPDQPVRVAGLLHPAVRLQPHAWRLHLPPDVCHDIRQPHRMEPPSQHQEYHLRSLRQPRPPTATHPFRRSHVMPCFPDSVNSRPAPH